jgi:hypothetical protein
MLLGLKLGHVCDAIAYLSSSVPTVLTFPDGVHHTLFIPGRTQRPPLLEVEYTVTVTRWL